MLKNRVNGCHGNHAFFIVQLSLSLRTKILCISWVPMNDLAPMKNCPGGCKVGQISSRVLVCFFSHLGFWSRNLFLIAPFPDLCLLVSFDDFHAGELLIVVQFYEWVLMENLY